MIPGIREVQELATKYSKAQLSQMAQNGLIDPTKAVMAGMMIDRISKQNMEPPKATVAQDVMTPPAPQMGMPQGQPQQAPASGVAGIPAPNMESMAGGGIVAFNDGGDVPGYADKGFVMDPAFQINPKDQAKRDEVRRNILLQELNDAQNRNDIQSVTMLQREISRMKPAPTTTDKVRAGLESLVPSAQAGELNSNSSSIPASDSTKTQSTLGIFADKIGNFFTGGQSAEQIRQKDLDRQRLQREIVDNNPGLLEQLTPDQRAERNKKAKDLNNQLDQLKASKLKSKSSAEVEKVTQKNDSIESPYNKFAAKEELVSAKDDPKKTQDTGLAAIKTEISPAVMPEMDKVDPLLISKKATPTAAEYLSNLTESRKAFGVDTDFYKKREQEVSKERDDLSEEKEQNKANVLMEMGLAIASGDSQYALQNIAKGGAFGLAARKAYQKEEKEKLKLIKDREFKLQEMQELERRGDASAYATKRDQVDELNNKIDVTNTEIKNKALETNFKATADLRKTIIEQNGMNARDAARFNNAVLIQGLSDKAALERVAATIAGGMSSIADKAYDNVAANPIMAMKMNTDPAAFRAAVDAETARLRAARGQMDTSASLGASPTSDAVDYLKKNPNLASQFDAKYGAGASARILGK